MSGVQVPKSVESHPWESSSQAWRVVGLLVGDTVYTSSVSAASVLSGSVGGGGQPLQPAQLQVYESRECVPQCSQMPAVAHQLSQ